MSQDMAHLRDYITAADHMQYANMAQGTVSVTCTHQHLQRKLIELRLELSMTIGDLKHKLHRHCGTSPEFMTLLLKRNGAIVAMMADDNRMLGFYGCESGMEIHIKDEDPFSLARGGGLENTALVDKYVMSDEAYASRKNTVRSYIEKKKAEDPNWQPPKLSKNPFKTMVGAAPPPGAVDGSTYPAPEIPTAESVSHVKVGERCQVMPGVRRGTVRFVGDIPSLQAGPWVGVEFDEPAGKNDGSHKGVSYFESKPNYGAFVRGKNVECGDFPEEDLDLEDSEEEL